MPIFRERGHRFFGARSAWNTYFLFYLSFFYIGVSSVSAVSTISMILLTRPIGSGRLPILLPPFFDLLGIRDLHHSKDLRFGQSGCSKGGYRYDHWPVSDQAWGIGGVLFPSR
jgi:hypothetical protein